MWTAFLLLVLSLLLQPTLCAPRLASLENVEMNRIGLNNHISLQIQVIDPQVARIKRAERLIIRLLGHRTNKLDGMMYIPPDDGEGPGEPLNISGTHAMEEAREFYDGLYQTAESIRRELEQVRIAIFGTPEDPNPEWQHTGSHSVMPQEALDRYRQLVEDVVFNSIMKIRGLVEQAYGGYMKKLAMAHMIDWYGAAVGV